MKNRHEVSTTRRMRSVFRQRPFFGASKRVSENAWKELFGTLDSIGYLHSDDEADAIYDWSFGALAYEADERKVAHRIGMR